MLPRDARDRAQRYRTLDAQPDRATYDRLAQEYRDKAEIDREKNAIDDEECYTVTDYRS